MIEQNKNFGYFEVYCDEPNCESYETFDAVDFYDAIAEMKDAGWGITRFNNNWHHICPDCNSEV